MQNPPRVPHFLFVEERVWFTENKKAKSCGRCTCVGSSPQTETFQSEVSGLAPPVGEWIRKEKQVKRRVELYSSLKFTNCNDSLRLIPLGHDVIAIACPERYVVGLDIAEKAVKKAEELSSSLPNANYCTFLKADFFSWQPTELFDLIFDYTFFCAIEPEMRSQWAIRIQDLLKPDGELITLIFPIDDHLGGPPYKVSVSDYEEVLCPIGFKAVSIVDNELAIKVRLGREKLGRWKRPLTQCLL
eukprot:XP_015580827.1 thiocyanate methyltransferase 1 isoform X2 [Ricinus communis]